MQTIALHPVRLAPAALASAPFWRPAPVAPATPGRPSLAQQQPPAQAAPGAPPIVMVPAPPKPSFLDSALIASMVDFTGAFVTGILAYGATYPGISPRPAPSRWAYVFGALAAGLVVKGLVDLSLVRER